MANIIIPKIGRRLDAPTDRSILNVALQAGVNYPHGCTIGRCGACKSRLIRGQVKQLSNSSNCLSKSEAEEGLFLACQSAAVSDTTIEWINDGLAPRFSHWQQGTIVFSEMVDLQVAMVQLRLDAPDRFEFAAGQYLSLAMPGTAPRHYSMANSPGSDLIELHIRIVKQGQSSSQFASAPIGTRVSVGGPLGDAYLRDGSAAQSLLVAGSGTGLAPIKAIVAQSLANAPKRPITVLSLNDGYIKDHFQQLAEINPTLSLKSHNSPQELITAKTKLAQKTDNWRNAEIYIAGSPAFVDIVTTLGTDLGVDHSKMYSDVFFTPVF